LNEGRLVHLIPEPAEGEEVDPDEQKKKIEAADPFEPRLKSLTDD
jgi:radial spoke head protein 4A